nr:hypothetical protein [Allomuricauda sp.]
MNRPIQISDFNALPKEDRDLHFWEYHGEVIDSLKKGGFDHYLFRDRASHLILEVKMNRDLGIMDVRAVSGNDIAERYPPGHEKADKSLWE